MHDYRRPRRLPPLMSGTPAYAFAPHEMAWSDPALSQSVSSASSASQSSSSSSSHYSSLASNRADRGYELEASPSFVQPRYPPEVYPRTRDGSEMDAALTGSLRYPPAEGSLPNSADPPHDHRVGRQDRSQSDEGYAVSILFARHIVFAFYNIRFASLTRCIPSTHPCAKARLRPRTTMAYSDRNGPALTCATHHIGLTLVDIPTPSRSRAQIMSQALQCLAAPRQRLARRIHSRTLCRPIRLPPCQ